MKFKVQTQSVGATAVAAFTMVEVALCLGIIAFALVAIIGIMPTGLQVQKDNREETLINVDGNALLEAIRLGDTNSYAISNNFEWMQFYTNGVLSFAFYHSNNIPTWQIIGALSGPKYDYSGGVITKTNVAKAKFIANSGAAWSQATNTNVRALVFSYLVTSEVVPFVPANQANGSVSNSLTTNLYDLRLTMAWPVFPNRTVGSNRRSFRTQISGILQDQPYTNGSTIVDFYFFRPNTF